MSGFVGSHFLLSWPPLRLWSGDRLMSPRQSPRAEPRRMRWFTAAPMFLAGLTACGTTAEYGPDSPYYPYPEGTRLILNQVLEIPPGSATVRLQYGRVVPRNGVQEHDPHCIFEIETVRQIAQCIEPDVFQVTRVQRSVWMSSLTPMAPLLTLHVGLGGQGSGPTLIYYQTEFRLRSERQPVVRALTCQSNQNAAGIFPNMRHLTVPEIRQALGTLLSLELPAQRL